MKQYNAYSDTGLLTDLTGAADTVGDAAVPAWAYGPDLPVEESESVGIEVQDIQANGATYIEMIVEESWNNSDWAPKTYHGPPAYAVAEATTIAYIWVIRFDPANQTTVALSFNVDRPYVRVGFRSDNNGAAAVKAVMSRRGVS